MIDVDSSIRICCNNSKVEVLVIDGANTPDIVVKVCSKHVSEKCFNQFVKYREKIKSSEPVSISRLRKIIQQIH